jgi:hypothetical protein
MDQSISRIAPGSYKDLKTFGRKNIFKAIPSKSG